MIKNQMNKENSSILAKNGGTVDRLGGYATFINKYLFLISEESYESAYELYATDLVSKKGYTHENITAMPTAITVITKVIYIILGFNLFFFMITPSSL